MQLLLVLFFFLTVLWPNSTAVHRTVVIGGHSDGARLQLRSATVVVKDISAQPTHTAEAAHAEHKVAFRTAEPLTRVPKQVVCKAVVAAADASGLPPRFLFRLIWYESRFDQHAVSPAGALGVAQFMPKVAAERGLEHPFDPLAAVWASAFFLQEHYRTFGNIGLAAMAYNAGAKRVLDWLARRGKLPGETRKYVTLVTGHPPEKWIEVQPLELALDRPRRAPCRDQFETSPGAGNIRIDVKLEEPILKIVETAKAEAAKAEAARKAKEAKIREAKAKQTKDKKAMKVAMAKMAKVLRARAVEKKKSIEAAARDAKAKNGKSKKADAAKSRKQARATKPRTTSAKKQAAKRRKVTARPSPRKRERLASN